ncbi:hypothetical protein GCM10022226_25460 [Sphaerisporangium flaviroseum]|uniref:Uncharacterized protein n=1 Tax=Sphaerisporangium flaviroseum TaxID=509199 RepID=A0ABP7HVC7_9ACTN
MPPNTTRSATCAVGCTDAAEETGAAPGAEDAGAGGMGRGGGANAVVVAG